MSIKKQMALSLAFATALLCASNGIAQTPAAGAKEQFVPLLVYRTGPYAPTGIPFADGVQDYWTLLNERDGGIDGVKIQSEDCETGYATDRGGEC